MRINEERFWATAGLAIACFLIATPAQASLMTFADAVAGNSASGSGPSQEQPGTSNASASIAFQDTLYDYFASAVVNIGYTSFNDSDQASLICRATCPAQQPGDTPNYFTSAADDGQANDVLFVFVSGAGSVVFDYSYQIASNANVTFMGQPLQRNNTGRFSVTFSNAANGFAIPYNLTTEEQASAVSYGPTFEQFSNAFMLNAIRVFDGAGNQITDYRYKDSAGAVLPFVGGSLTTIPEPGTLPMFTLSTLVWWTFRKVCAGHMNNGS